MDFLLFMAFCAVFALIALRLHARRRGPMKAAPTINGAPRQDYIRRPARKEAFPLKAGNE